MGVTVTLVGADLTVTLQVAVLPLEVVTVMVEEPFFTPVTKPSSSTSTYLGLLLVKVRSRTYSTSGSLPSTTTSGRVSLSPMFSLAEPKATLSGSAEAAASTGSPSASWSSRAMPTSSGAAVISSGVSSASRVRACSSSGTASSPGAPVSPVASGTAASMAAAGASSASAPAGSAASSRLSAISIASNRLFMTDLLLYIAVNIIPFWDEFVNFL